MNPVNGYGGVTVWYKDSLNYIHIVLYYEVRVYESIDGSFEANVGQYYAHPYSTPPPQGSWIKLHVDADSKKGELVVYVNDSYLFTYYATTPNRSGLSGLMDGNAGVYFDDFRLTSRDIHSHPQTDAGGKGLKITAPVPQTGQTTSYGTGDDGALEKGLPWPDPRFTDNGDGTVTDNLTGLIWLKDAYCAGDKTWAAALTFCNTLASGSCDLSDGSSVGEWRLPNIRDLTSLIHYGFSPTLPNTAGTGPWTDGDPFTNVQVYWYWSSTSSVDSPPNNAWHVNMASGDVLPADKGNGLPVWAVRDAK
jgi:hypothetical protein